MRIQLFFIHLVFLVYISTISTKHFELPVEIVETPIIQNKSGTSRILESKAGTEIILSQSSNRRILADVCIGTPPQCFKFKISTTYGLMWLVDSEVDVNGFDTSVSSTYRETKKTEKVKEKAGQVTGILVKDTISFGEFMVDNFPFLLTNSENVDYTEYVGSFGLAYQYHNNDYSFLSLIKREGFIDEERFFIQFEQNTSKGILFFGEALKIQNIIKKNPYKFKKCDVINKKNKDDLNDRWECNLHGIYLSKKDDIKYKLIRDRISFNLSGNASLVTKDFFEFFIQQWMKEEFDKKQCRIYQTVYFSVIECNEGFNPRKLGSMNYIIGKYTIKLYGEDLFFKIGGNYYSTITVHSQVNAFTLGFDLFRKFIVEYNKDRSYVGWMKK